MRVVTNDKIINRNKMIAQSLFFVSMGLLVLSFFGSNRLSSDENLALVTQCGAIPLLFGLVIASVRMTNSWVRQPYPWEQIQAGLKGIGSETVLYNFLLPAPHVLIGSNGIYALTTRFQEKPQKVKDDHWDNLMGLLTLMRQEQIGNPTKEARLKAAKTEAYLQALLGDEGIIVYPVVVFVHPNANVTIEGELSVPVVYAAPDKKKLSLKNLIRDAKSENHPSLSKEQLAELDDVLLYDD
jgi:hypothetical protein